MPAVGAEEVIVFGSAHLSSAPTSSTMIRLLHGMWGCNRGGGEDGAVGLWAGSGAAFVPGDDYACGKDQQDESEEIDI